MKTIALVFHGDSNPPRNLFDNENFKELADTIMEVGFSILPVQYHYSVAKQVEAELEKVAAVMSWVEPVDRMVKGKDNLNFDELLTSITQKGVLVSTHPEVIFKLGTKKVLYSTRDMDWGGDTELYANPVDFEKRFLRSLAGSRPRILKQYRGSSGRGVFKVWLENGLVRVIHASGGDQWSYAE
ncbi:MAG: hypothetical protein FWE76_03965, partial [Symbiobacteriaceae bacterium]|nr:hypothetical protein [Symbiobacteriaceae bacterium]